MNGCSEFLAGEYLNFSPEEELRRKFLYFIKDIDFLGIDIGDVFALLEYEHYGGLFD